MGCFIFRGLPYFSDNQGIIWTSTDDDIKICFNSKQSQETSSD